MFDFLTRLFDPSGFVPRRACGAWTTELVVLHNASDGLVWLAYLTIPVLLVYFARRRRDLPFPRLFWLFAAFILSCGFTHLLEVVIFYCPVYRLSGVCKLATAVASWATVAALVPVLPRALLLRGPRELEREVAERTAALTGANEALRAEVEQRRVAERELAASEERFRQLADAMPQIVWTARPDGSHDYYNRRWYDFTGFVRGEEEKWPPVLHPEDEPGCLEGWVAAVRSGQPYEVEYRLRDFRAGDYRWFLGRALPVKDGDGRVVRWFGTSTDVDDRKRAEQELLRAHNELEQRVRKRTAELTVANRRLCLEIEERRGVEARLRERAEEMETLLEVLPVPVWIARDPQCRSMVGNRATYELLGLPSGANVSKSAPPGEMPGTFRAFRDGKELSPGDLPMQQAAATGTEVRDAEVDLVFTGGAVRTIYGSAAPLFDECNQVRGCIGAFMDVTTRRDAEEALRRSEERYRAVVESQTEVVCRVRADGTFLFVNDVYRRTFGTSRDQVSGQDWTTHAHPDDVARVKEELATLCPAHPVVRIESRFHDGEGRVRWMEFVNRGFFDGAGELLEFQSVGRDVTDRRNAEDALRESEERFRNAFDHAPVGMYACGLDGRWLKVNAALCEITGRTAEELLASDWQAITHPDDLATDFARGRQLLAGEIPYNHVEKRYLHKRGHVVWVFLAGSLVRGADGRPLYFVGHVHDVSQRKEAEARVASSLAEKEVLLKEVHHRVKNNLQIISSLLHLQAGKAEDARTAELFRESQGRVRAMALVHERLYRSRDMARVGFADYVRPLVDHLFRAYRIDAERIRLEAEVEPVRLSIDAAVPCGLLLNELVSNSLKHAFPGDRLGVLRIGLAMRGDDTVVLRVGDDGVGLPGTLTLDNADTFGLQLVATLAGQLGGRVEVERDPGTVFQVTFPGSRNQVEQGG